MHSESVETNSGNGCRNFEEIECLGTVGVALEISKHYASRYIGNWFWVIGRGLNFIVEKKVLISGVLIRRTVSRYY